MSANKTDALKQKLVAVSVIFAVFYTLFFLAVAANEELSHREKIEHGTQGLSTTGIIFLGFGAIVNAYYVAKRSDAIEKNTVATEKTNEINIKNAHLGREQLIAERLMTAITQLGHEKVATRTGAIYALERVAQDSRKEYWTIMEIISAFIRENAPKSQDNSENNRKTAKIDTDIQAALTVIGRRDFQKDRKNQKLDLRNTDIRWADLQGANLQKLDLRRANMQGANLKDADLSASDLESVQLSGAILYNAKLRSCNLLEANLSGANLNRALFCKANLRSANLSGATLLAANFTDANLYKANLQLANLKVANFCGAKLFLANLQGAKIDKAKLQGTGLIGANLQQASLNGADLNGANLNAAKLQYTEVFFANLTDASLREADLHGANLMGSNLQNAILSEANLSAANLMGANLNCTNLDRVRLDGTILKGAKNLTSQQIKVANGEV